MPKYEYACKSCGQHLEVTQSFSDAPLTECETCGGPLRKVFSAPAITFKGSGFYRTDNIYRRTSEPKADSPSSDSSSTSGASDASGASGGKAEPAKKESAPAADGKAKAAEAKTA